ncbi:transposase [Actinomadura graeca]|uniref:Transposase n=1 Tax=Actinomadura graeca TaxID=2750812 RepID=A0ABX8QZ08_9ACTN|nr:transposase [Actinomadura graeca]QXJ24046.1 transposase [Actinomadura graeca]
MFPLAGAVRSNSTAPPSQTLLPALLSGIDERFHHSLRRELLDDVVPFDDLDAARAAVAGWVVDYNTRRPHQSLSMAYPADRFDTRTAQDEQELLPLRLPAAVRLATVPPARDPRPVAEPTDPNSLGEAAPCPSWSAIAAPSTGARCRCHGRSDRTTPHRHGRAGLCGFRLCRTFGGGGG